ncbi:acyl-CoA desaturase [Haliangium sp.]|uniref:acyl-CoA desaturase n=1 Tax=Haliangium sp. TaxID=2663208 RepID=UPI003D0A52B3
MPPTESPPTTVRSDADRVRWVQTIPFWGVHVAAVVGVVWLGWSWSGLLLAVGLYYLRLFGITAGFHRYFAHRSFRTGRVMQFLFALLGGIAAQKGVLWWAAHHRHHHKYSDEPEDVHSPRQRGFWWSHVGWILVRRYQPIQWEKIPDLAKYPELRFLTRFDGLVNVAFAVLLFALGGSWALVWGFFVSLTLAWHGTFTINSFSHIFGRRRYDVTDDSKNNWLLAILTLGEGWHNNHHYYQRSVRQGFYWWEIDVSYYILKAMSWVGLVHDLHTVPARIRDPEAARVRIAHKAALREARSQATVEAKLAA